MTIAQVEVQTGMTRANIRFYESKGLITPRRAGNTYRDYSDEDMAALLKVKLLRQLHVSIEDIKKLQSGELELDKALSDQLRQLESDMEQMATAAEICRDIQVSHADYPGLDAPRYLSWIESAARNGAGFFSVKADELPKAAAPWRRFFARSLDVFIYTVIWIAICSLAFRVNPLSSGFVQLLNFLVPYILMLIAEPILLSTLGTTPGKWILGLVVRRADGNKLTYSSALDRILLVYQYGMGYVIIPFYNLYRLYVSYAACQKNEIPWDESYAYTLKNKKPVRIAAFILAYIAVYLLLLGVHLQAQMPRHRGDITAAEFTQNFNELMNYFDLYGGRHLDTSGKWVEDPFAGTVYLNLLGPEPSDFSIEEEHSVVTKISYTMTAGGDASPISLFYLDEHISVINIAIKSFVCAQRDVNFINQFSVIKPEVSAFINGFSYTRAGVTVTCTADYSGYEKARDDLLFPIENAQTYYHMTFTMEKTG